VTSAFATLSRVTYRGVWLQSPLNISQVNVAEKTVLLHTFAKTIQSRSLPQSRSACKAIPVVALVDDTVPVDTQLECGRHRGERVDLNVAGGGIDVRDLSLAVEGIQAILPVVLEEAV